VLSREDAQLRSLRPPALMFEASANRGALMSVFKVGKK